VLVHIRYRDWNLAMSLDFISKQPLHEFGIGDHIFQELLLSEADLNRVLIPSLFPMRNMLHKSRGVPRFFNLVMILYVLSVMLQPKLGIKLDRP
jgi:hypothetical protein